jgi:hypothetical protein
MVLVYLKDEECVEVEGAVSAEVQGDEVICFSEDGSEAARFPSSIVLSFTNSPKIIEAVAEEICDEPTIIPA